MKQILAFALTLSLAFVFLCSDFSYAGEASYGKSYTMENFLSDYQYVVENNTVIKNHTVGAVLTGGPTWIESFGDARHGTLLYAECRTRRQLQQRLLFPRYTICLSGRCLPGIL